MLLFVSLTKAKSKQYFYTDSFFFSRVIESKNSKYPTDTIITGPFGWCTHLVPDVALLNSKLFQTFPSDMPPSYALGVLGLTG